MHIESRMMTGCAYEEHPLLNGTTTIFCDSHEIGNVFDVEGIKWMLEDCRKAPLSIFLTLPSTIPATNDKFCPVKALKNWLDVARIDKGPLFYKINKSNTIEKYTMNYKNQKVSLIVKDEIDTKKIILFQLNHILFLD